MFLEACYEVSRLHDEEIEANNELRHDISIRESAEVITAGWHKLQSIKNAVQAARRLKTFCRQMLQVRMRRFSSHGRLVTCLTALDVTAIRIMRDFGGMRVMFCIGSSSAGGMPLHVRREMHRLSRGVIDMQPEHIYELTAAGQFRNRQ